MLQNEEQRSPMKKGSATWDSLGVPHTGAIALIESGRGVGASLFANAAEVHDDAAIDWIGRGQGVAVVGAQEIMIDGPVLNESALGAAIVSDKGATKGFLLEHGIRTPRGLVVNSVKEAIEVANSFSRTVVVKPNGGGQGRGVTVDVEGEGQVRAAYETAKRAGSPVLVEEYVDIDNEFRCLTNVEKCVAVVERTLPVVVGNGRSTIRQLIADKNIKRKDNPGLRYLPIPVDHIVDLVLQRQDKNVDSIPMSGEEVLVRNVGGLSGGGEPHEASARVPEELKDLARETVAAIPGLAWGAVDIVTERGSGTPYVIEINCRAHYAGATFPVTGEPVDIASDEWKARIAGNTADPATWCESMGLRSHLQLANLMDESDRSERPPLTNVFLKWLRNEGYAVDTGREAAFHVIGENVDTWFTPVLLTDSDGLAPIRMLRRHSLVRALLARGGVPRPKGGLVRGPEEVLKVAESRKRALIATPATQAWKSPSTRKVTVEDREALFERRRRWYVQHHRQGTRITVLASRNEAFAVVANDASSNSLHEGHLREVRDLSLAAVRAVPELRWGAVDLVMTGLGNNFRWRVEGITLGNSVPKGGLIVAGDIESFFLFLIDDVCFKSSRD